MNIAKATENAVGLSGFQIHNFWRVPIKIPVNCVTDGSIFLQDGSLFLISTVQSVQNSNVFEVRRLSSTTGKDTAS